MTHPWVLPFERLDDDAVPMAGGKAVALARMARSGLRVPPGFSLSTDAYRAFVGTAGIADRISLELGRKRFEDMRWEELWDAALRVRNAFLRADWPRELRDPLLAEMRRIWGEDLDQTPLAVRSSAPGEDAGSTSFAGLHESVVNVRGAEAVLEAVRKVWASLWSDRALLYRQELGLDVKSSAMAVVIQEMVAGTCSGVVFTRSPTGPGSVVVEAVWGLNEGLVDGTVEPDHWELSRDDGSLLQHREVTRACVLSPAPDGVRLEPLTDHRRNAAPLSREQLAMVVDLGHRAEALFGGPQDVEWTIRGDLLYALQARPISTLAGFSGGRSARGVDDAASETKATGRSDRAWYLSLTRSLENLKGLRRRLEEEEIPAMLADAERMVSVDLCSLDDASLQREVEQRTEIRDGWVEVYWRDFIPFAHGMRLFGQVYNDDVAPEDPFEFISLLVGGRLVSLERDSELRELASLAATEPRPDPGADHGQTGRTLDARLDAYLDRFGSGPNVPPEVRKRERLSLLQVLRQLSTRTDLLSTDPQGSGPSDAPSRSAAYLERFEGEERATREDLLDLARASYELRDNDNLYLDRIEAQLQAAVAEASRRHGRGAAPADVGAADTIRALEDPAEVIGEPDDIHSSAQGHLLMPSGRDPEVRARQLVGQPAGPGLGTGRARVVRNQDDLYLFEAGEVLVCDSLDPTMTFVAQLASAIVERRGGMLIHGAIIAREYGLPCVTGLPMATEVINTGDMLTVDGYLGIVVVSRKPPA
jgi:phosphohistidine swiveling domain-containing protein